MRKKTTRRQYALKVMAKSRILAGSECSENAEMVLIERNVLCCTSSPFVVSVAFAFQTSKALFLALELLEGGNLHDCRKDCGGRLPEGIVVYFTAQIVLGLRHLHKLGFIYRDLKPLNVMLDRRGNAILTDLGLACKIRRTNAQKAQLRKSRTMSQKLKKIQSEAKSSGTTTSPKRMKSILVLRPQDLHNAGTTIPLCSTSRV